MDRILLGMPYYPGAMEPHALMAAQASAFDGAEVLFHGECSTGTAKTFNRLWAMALNMAKKDGLTHFAMQHADVVPKQGSLETLYGELNRTGAAMVSAVSPIKDDRALTSTGIDWFADNPFRVRRYAMAEILRLPETFNTQDTIDAGLNPQGRPLLVNTAYWICDLRDPVWYETDATGGLYFLFTFNDRIERGSDGSWVPRTESEDWFFSRRMAAKGLSYYATRKVQLTHEGKTSYPNWKDFGRWKTDEATPEKNP